MRAKRGHALFHAIVSMGAASVQACGGVAVDSSHAGDGQGAGSAGSGSAGSTASAGAASLFAAGGSGNATSVPFTSATGGNTTIASAGSPGHLDAGSTGIIGIGGSRPPMDGGVPSLCAHLEQLVCSFWDPTPQNCSCNPNAPLSAADCPTSNYEFHCHSYAPQVGCECVCVVCIH